MCIVAELAEHGHADGLLRFNELTVEQFDQHVPLTGLQQVAAQLDDTEFARLVPTHRRVNSMIQFVSQSWSLRLNACCHRA